MPLLTVIVPTKNRQHTAIATISEAAKLAPAAELEIVVHDCSDEPLLREQLAAASLLDRVVYRYVDTPVSMTENWNLAAQYATGEWLTIIGDDDAVVAGILDAARWATPQDLDAVKAERYSYYGHPDLPDPSVAARLRVAPFTGAVRIQETAPLLHRAVRTGDAYAELPMIYHNLVRRRLLERIRAKGGHYFDGLAPDIYSAIATGALIDRFGVVDYPMTILGASARSNTNRVAVGTIHLHAAEYTNFHYTWLTPESFIYAASIPDNVVRALTDVGREDLLAELDVPRIYARTIRAEPRRFRDHLRKYIQVRKRQQLSVATGVAVLGAGIVVKLFLDAAHTVRRPKAAEGMWFDAVPTLAAAIELQSEWLRAHGVTAPLEQETR